MKIFAGKTSEAFFILTMGFIYVVFTQFTNQETTSKPLQRIREFGLKYKGEIGIAFLLFYIFLLGLGTVGEVWDIEWIHDLPIFRPPGKY